MPKTVPNQRVIRVHRERASSDFLGIKNERWMAASRILGATALRLYLYLASNEVPQSDTQTKTADGQDSPTDKPKNPADDIEINNINNKNSIINTVQGQQVVPASKDFVF